MHERKLIHQTARVAILDDHEVVLLGLSRLLEAAPDIDLIGALPRARDLIALLRREHCDIAVVDFVLAEHEMDGLNLIRHLAARFPDTKILVISGYDNLPTIDFSIRAGASGFFSKAQALDELLPALRAVCRGSCYLPPIARVAQMAARRRRPALDADRSVDGAGIACSPILSGREQDVLRCCLQGLSARETAQKFSRSVKTIRNQRRAAFRKLGIRTVGELFTIHRRLSE
jgi:DNA-binding NarL/FixJ family response regulator